MDTMSKTTPSADKVDVFGGNQAAALGASIVLAAALLFGTIYTGSGDDEKSGRREQVRPPPAWLITRKHRPRQDRSQDTEVTCM